MKKEQRKRKKTIIRRRVRTTCSVYHCSRPAMAGVQALKKQYCLEHWRLFLLHMPGGNAPLSKEEVRCLTALVRPLPFRPQDVDPFDTLYELP